MTRQQGAKFSYEGVEIDSDLGEVRCHYSLDGESFLERIIISSSAGLDSWQSGAAEIAARWLFLLAGVSYYKASAPLLIDLGDQPMGADEVDFLRRYYLHGLGEFAYRLGLDLSSLRLEGASDPDGAGLCDRPVVTDGRGVTNGDGRGAGGPPRKPLVPFGGGIDSIVTTELVRRRLATIDRAVGSSHDDGGGDGSGDGAAGDVKLFVVSRLGDRYAAIEGAAAVSGLPILRAERQLDAKILRSTELGYFNGHVPVTGVVSAIAVLTAVVHGRDAVIMSNEASASVGNVVTQDGIVNHQWSKSIEFEAGYRAAVAATGVEYFSALRAASELWVARQFAGLPEYHETFRSCNKAFYVDTSRRLEYWCGECDKCCFVDLVLAPFMSPGALSKVFAGREPLAKAALVEKFRVLLGLLPAAKPWDCVGDTAECRAALLQTAGRRDRQEFKLVQDLASELSVGHGPDRAWRDDLADFSGPHFIPAAYAPADLLA